MSEFVLDDEFRDYWSAPGKVSNHELEQSLLEAGRAREPLVVAQLPSGSSYLADGYRRYAVCERHHLPYTTVVKQFPRREAVFDFLDSLQISERNLSHNQLARIRGRRKLRWERVVGCVTAAHDTARMYGVSMRTVYRDAIYAAAVAKLSPFIRETAVETLTQAQAIALSQLPRREQAAALKEPARLKAPKPQPGFEEYRDGAAKAVFRLKCALDGMHTTRADAIRLRSAKQRTHEIVTLLTTWATGYNE